MKSTWVDSIAVIFFVLLVGVFFRQTIFDGKLPVPSDALVGLYHPWRDFYSVGYPRGVPFKNFLITDPVRQQIPWRKMVIDELKEGKIPAWNPFNFSGFPILSNIQAAPLYPLNVLFLVFPFIDAWTMLIILQPMLAGLFMYWYLRSLGLASVAGLVGAIAWSFSGFNVAWLTWGTIGHVALWLPLTLLSIDKLFQTRLTKAKRSVWSMVIVGSLVFQFFAGHVQISLYFILVIISYGVMRVLQAKERKKLTLVFVFLLSLVAILTVVQWIPFLDWIRQSSRVAGGADFTKEGWFIPWPHLVQFVVPDFFGNPTTLNYWGQWNYGEFIGYIGILPLVFAFIAIVSPTFKKHWFWIGASVFALLFALPTPIAYLPFILKVPVLSSLQPTRLLFIVDFALAMLAAYGCHEFLGNSKKRRMISGVALVGAALTILWGIIVASRFGLLDPSFRPSFEVSSHNLVLPTVIFFVGASLVIMYRRVKRVTMFRTIVVWSIIGLTAADMLRFGWKFTPFTTKQYLFPETKIITFLKGQEKPFRVMSLDKRILPPNTLSYYGIESIEGYDPIISSRYEELMAAIARGKPDISPPFGFNRIITLEGIDTKLEPLLNARYVLSLSALSESYLRHVLDEGETKVYEDTRALPRAYLVERLVPATGKEDVIVKLYGLSDLRLEAVVEGKPEVINVPLQPNETTLITRYEPNLIEMDVHVVVPRFLVISNTFDRGWRARVDGKETPIYRTNYAFQGIVVPTGTHNVVFSYTL